MSDIREALNTAFDEEEKKVETDPNVIDVVATEVPPGDTPAADIPIQADDTPADPGAAATDTPAAEATPGTTPDTTAAEEGAAATPTIDPKDPIAKAPGSWTPGAREHWATLSPEVKSEVWKREREASRALTVSTEARKLQSEFSQVMQPFLGFIAAEKSTPMHAVKLMMETAAGLRVGSPQQKVQIVAETIRNFGIDLKALDSVLAGQQPTLDPKQMVQQEIQRALAPYQQREQQATQHFQQQTQQQATAELETFAADPKHEFYDDVAPLMADLMEVAARNGQQMGLTQAYERAILIHEPVRRVIDARTQREAAQKASLAARQARGAAVSVTPSAGASQVTTQAGDTLRSDIEAAIAQTQGR